MTCSGISKDELMGSACYYCWTKILTWTNKMLVYLRPAVTEEYAADIDFQPCPLP